MKTRFKIIFCLFLLGTFYKTQAIELPNVISDNMILQRDKAVNIWGKAKPNEKITVKFKKQNKKTKADAEGKWQLSLDPLKASATPSTMEITGVNEKITLKNILVGEVWLASGQSNMEYAMKPYHSFLPPMRGEDIAKLELQKPENQMIRVMNCMRGDSKNSWEVANGKSLESTSQVGYFFGKAIQEKLDVPVGIITSAIGGTQIEAWTTTEAYVESPIFSPILKSNNGHINGKKPGNWYEKMIAPLVPFTFKGVLWYQGENNCATRDKLYAEKFKILVESWRRTFNNPDVPFYYVLLAPHIYSDRVHGKVSKLTAEDLPIFRMQQIEAGNVLKNTDYIAITDLTDKIDDIHPSYKWEVGERLANMALAKSYNLPNIIWSGPRLKQLEILKDSIVISFDHCSDGLKSNDEKRLNWFEICDENGIFRPALADIKENNKVVVYHPEIKTPQRIRFGWHETAIPNLVNSNGLPASPFCSALKQL